MKKPLLLILLMLTLPLLSFGTSPSMPGPTPSGSESVTVSVPPQEAVPTWGEILGLDQETAKILDEEIALALKDQWESGYKAARVEYEPQVDYWLAIATSPPPPDRFWSGAAWGSATGVVVGVTAASAVLLLLVKAAR